MYIYIYIYLYIYIYVYIYIYTAYTRLIYMRTTEILDAYVIYFPCVDVRMSSILVLDPESWVQDPGSWVRIQDPGS